MVCQALCSLPGLFFWSPRNAVILVGLGFAGHAHSNTTGTSAANELKKADFSQNIHCTLSPKPPPLYIHALSKPLRSVIHISSQFQKIWVERLLSVQTIPYIECSLCKCDFFKLLPASISEEGKLTSKCSISPTFYLYMSILLTILELKPALIHVSASVSERCTVPSLHSLLVESKCSDIEQAYHCICKPRISNHRFFTSAIAVEHIHTALHSIRQSWRPSSNVPSIL